MTSCHLLLSCERCIQQPPALVDVGTRCVWCPSLGGCAEYVKHTFDFPCADAIRAGGGYPGGAQCPSQTAVNPLPFTRGNASKPTPRFSYTPQTSEPVTIVIASFGRPSNLPTAAAYLLQLEPLRRPRSELLISHGSRRSLASAAACDATAASICAAAPAPGCAVGKLRHVDATALNRRYFAAQRFFSARRNGSNAVLLHVDDDLVPTEAMLQALVDHVAQERGFPHYAWDAPGLVGPSSFRRSCGPAGYTRGHQPADAAHPAVLTNLAATSAVANARFVDAFAREGYAPLLLATRGNGEDLLFSHAIGRAGGERQTVGACAESSASRDSCGLRQGEFAWIRGDEADEVGAARNQAHKQPRHYDTRDTMCRCLAGGRVGEQLLTCVVGREESIAVSRASLLEQLESEASFPPPEWHFQDELRRDR
ncbi:hypothetical protein AB1Y20_001630 [Prymnesium parvum]|uniref:Ceramide glucosyltransferase n=1 Tax=Prymnesium parvum TaxID=97485 RepID=A0AB34KD24_PRYPA